MAKPHVHREPSRLENASAVPNETYCRPSPCGRPSRPRTTTAAPPLVRLIGEAWLDTRRTGRAITLLGRASLVPLLTLEHPRLGFDVSSPDSGLLLPWSIAGFLVVPAILVTLFRSLGLVAAWHGFQPPKPFPIPGRDSRTASVLAGMGTTFSEGVRRFLLVTMRGFYLAGLPWL
jgi:hypothetical protein